jgi:hypothetical protein
LANQKKTSAGYQTNMAQYRGFQQISTFQPESWFS